MESSQAEVERTYSCVPDEDGTLTALMKCEYINQCPRHFSTLNANETATADFPLQQHYPDERCAGAPL